MIHHEVGTVYLFLSDNAWPQNGDIKGSVLTVIATKRILPSRLSLLKLSAAKQPAQLSTS